MSVKMTTGLFVLINTCSTNSTPPAATPDVDAPYSCFDSFDTDCRFRATVDIQRGLVRDAHNDGESFFTSGATFENVQGRVTVTDTAGQLGPVSCSFTFDATFESDISGTNASADAHVTLTQNVRYTDPNCPIECDWWMPAAGDFQLNSSNNYAFVADSSGNSGTFSLEIGAGSSPWLETTITPVDEEVGGYVGAVGAVALLPSSWSVPVQLDGQVDAASSCMP